MELSVPVQIRIGTQNNEYDAEISDDYILAVPVWGHPNLVSNIDMLGGEWLVEVEDREMIQRIFPSHPGDAFFFQTTTRGIHR